MSHVHTTTNTNNSKLNSNTACHTAASVTVLLQLRFCTCRHLLDINCHFKLFLHTLLQLCRLFLAINSDVVEQMCRTEALRLLGNVKFDNISIKNQGN